MDEAMAKAMVSEFGAELVRQRAVAESATRQATGLIQIVSGFIEMFPGLVDGLDEPVAIELSLRGHSRAMEVFGLEEDTPTVGEAVRRLLQSHPGTTYFVSELVQYLRERGWLPESDNPASAVRAALERLVNIKANDVNKATVNGKVAYYYDPDVDGETIVTYGAGQRGRGAILNT